MEERETKAEETEQDSETEETSTQEEPKETLDDKFARLEERLARAEALAVEKDKGFKTLQRAYDRLYKEKTVEEPETKVATINKKIVDELDRQRNPNYADDPQSQARIQALKEELAIAERDEARKAQVRKQQKLSQDARNDLEDKIREAGQDPEDEKFDSVWDSWELSSLADGKFERADNKLTRILSRMKPKEEEEKPVEEKKETEAELEARFERKFIEKYNLNPKDKLTPKGTSENAAQIRKNYRENPGDPENLRKFMELQNQGG